MSSSSDADRADFADAAHWKALDDAAIARLNGFTLSADYLRRSIEKSDRAFFVFAHDGTETYYVSPAFERIWGRPRSFLYESPARWMETLHPDDADEVQRRASEHRQTADRARAPLEYRIVLPTGEVRWIWGYLFLVDDQHGAGKLLCGISEDITSHKQAALDEAEAKRNLEAIVAVRTAEITEVNDLLRQEITQRKETELSLRRQQEFLKQLLYAQDLERKFISFDIHDGAIQNVIAARMHLESGLRDVPADQTGAKEIREALRLLEGVLGETRRIIAGIRPPTLDDLGIGAAVEELVAENGRQGLEVTYTDGTARARWSPTLEMTIYRVVQESLSNVRRHGDTDQATVDIAVRDNEIFVTVADAGRGFDPAAVAEREFGLQGIRERTNAVGGRCSVVSAPGRGTVVSAVFPQLDPEEMARAAGERAEKALQISRSRLESVLEYTPAVVFIKDVEGKYEFVNRRFAELFHVDPSAFIGRTDFDIHPAEIADAVRANDAEVVTQDTALTIEESVPSDGEMREYVSVKFPIPGIDGRKTSVCGIATDITERKHELLELRENRNRFCSFMDHLPMPAWLKAVDGSYVWANRRFLEFHRTTLEQLVGKTDFNLFPAETAELLQEHDRQTMASTTEALLHGSDRDARRAARGLGIDQVRRSRRRGRNDGRRHRVRSVTPRGRTFSSGEEPLHGRRTVESIRRNDSRYGVARLRLFRGLALVTNLFQQRLKLFSFQELLKFCAVLQSHGTFQRTKQPELVSLSHQLQAPPGIGSTFRLRRLAEDRSVATKRGLQRRGRLRFRGRNAIGFLAGCSQVSAPQQCRG
ncbi:MAG: PAS domain-containing protein [Pirellulales bacterium]